MPQTNCQLYRFSSLKPQKYRTFAVMRYVLFTVRFPGVSVDLCFDWNLKKTFIGFHQKFTIPAICSAEIVFTLDLLLWNLNNYDTYRMSRT
jgi:hypothetical protein